jgi:Uma2 family endonuclease
MGKDGGMRTQWYLTPADQGRRLSLEEFEHAAGQEGYRYELIDGKVEVSPAPNLSHQRLKKWLERLLDTYAEAHPAVFNHVEAPARVFIPQRPGETTPEADLVAYRDFPLGRSFADLRWQDVSPLLVIEILSEDNPEKDLVRNLDLYLQVPTVREYWILDPRDDADRPTLLVYRRRGRQWQRPVNVPSGGTYTTRLLPGFSLQLTPRG